MARSNKSHAGASSSVKVKRLSKDDVIELASKQLVRYFTAHYPNNPIDTMFGDAHVVRHDGNARCVFWEATVMFKPAGTSEFLLKSARFKVVEHYVTREFTSGSLEPEATLVGIDDPAQILID